MVNVAHSKLQAAKTREEKTVPLNMCTQPKTLISLQAKSAFDDWYI